MTRSLDEMLDALGNVQRRKLLVALLDHNPQDDSPVVVADSESDAEAMKRLVQMDHVHLPKLEEYGFVEWDRRNDEVVKGPHFDDIRPLLELLAAHADELPDRWLRPRRVAPVLGVSLEGILIPSACVSVA